ncbi:MAG TPA: hypothetical protein VIM93_08905 [Kangiella sp.]
MKHITNQGSGVLCFKIAGVQAMSKATFTVTVIREGREKDYYDFWVHDLKENKIGEMLNSEVVGFTEIVEAKNKQEAISKVRELHPRLRIDEDATYRLG